MSGKKILENYGVDRNTFESDFKRRKTDAQNLINCDPDDRKLPLDSKHLKKGFVESFSEFSCAPPSNHFPYALQRLKAYATRDFPKHCGAHASRVSEKRTEGFPVLVTAEPSNAVNCVVEVATKPLTIVKCEPDSRNYDTGGRTSGRCLKKEDEKVAATPGRLKQSVNHAIVKSVDQANLSVVPYNAALADKNEVKETLKLFRELYKQLLDKYKLAKRKGEGGTCARRIDVEAACWLRKRGKWIHSVKQFGHIPGIAIGDQFHFRAELAVVGLHCQFTSGIDYVVLDGKKFAVSIVNSGRYENKARTVDVLLYSGQGGLAGWGGSSKMDQKLERGNLALVNSKEAGYPVRVIHKSKCLRAYDTWGGFAYAYDGLYVVEKFWQERDHDGKFVFKFELHRMPGQQKQSGELRKSIQKECCVVDDVSQGKENVPIRAMNGIDGEKPPTFTYITSVVYPEWFKQISPSGCNCNDGCSNSAQCLCVRKNRGEILFSGKGTILGPKSVVYECSRSCKCPPSCMNRVSQHGLKYKLELYKTESRGWGVRSRSYISSGSFICEYIGKLQLNKVATLNKKCISSHDNQSDKNETGFKIDATKLGNVGRFISCSSSPNLFAQGILYDHDYEGMPHIMLFAAKNIPPLQELTCDYNHQMDGICQYQYQLQ